MTGTLAQLISLVTFGNEYLDNTFLHNTFQELTTFKFCKEVDFTIYKKPFLFSAARETVWAKDINGWFAKLKDDGCKHLKLNFQNSDQNIEHPDYVTVAFIGGGGTWFIEAVYDNFSTIWVADWKHIHGEENKVWNVHYRQISKIERENIIVSLPNTKLQLEQILKEISSFAYEINLHSFGKTFDNAIETLQSKNPSLNYYSDMLPHKGYSLQAKQILYSACNAWVFGGMGSWNDNMFYNEDIQKKHDSLSSSLFNIIMQAISQSVNSMKCS